MPRVCHSFVNLQLFIRCSNYLKSFLAVETDFELLPSVGELSCLSPGTSDALLGTIFDMWCNNFSISISAIENECVADYIQLASAFIASDDAKVVSVTDSKTEMAKSCRNFHIYMCMDFVSKLVESVDTSLRSQAIQILRFYLKFQ